MGIEEALRMYNAFYRGENTLVQYLRKEVQTIQHNLVRILEDISLVEKDPRTLISKGSQAIENFYKQSDRLRMLREPEQQQVEEPKTNRELVRTYLAEHPEIREVYAPDLYRILNVQKKAVYVELDHNPDWKKTKRERQVIYVKKEKKPK